ncbi:MAG: ArsC family reductase [Thiothrix sp.]
MTILYGISHCDTVKKARAWLEERGIPYTFHDFRKDGLNPVWLRAWTAEFGWETLVNRKGTTWRNLPEETRAAMDEATALAVMEAQPTIIKRPLLDLGTRRVVGFAPDTYRELFQN